LIKLRSLEKPTALVEQYYEYARSSRRWHRRRTIISPLPAQVQELEDSNDSAFPRFVEKTYAMRSLITTHGTRALTHADRFYAYVLLYDSHYALRVKELACFCACFREDFAKFGSARFSLERADIRRTSNACTFLRFCNEYVPVRTVLVVK
jgi:hypothetical protein